MKNNRHEIVRAMSMITQFAISVVTPILLCLFGAKFIVDKFLPNHRYLIAIGILLGAASGFYSMLKLIKAITGPKKDE